MNPQAKTKSLSEKNILVGIVIGIVVFSVLLRQGMFAVWEDSPIILGMKGRDIGLLGFGVGGAIVFGLLFTVIEGSAVAQTRGNRILLGFLGVLGCFVAGTVANIIGQAWSIVLIPVAAFLSSVILGYFME